MVDKAGFWSPCLPPELLGITALSLELQEWGVKQIKHGLQQMQSPFVFHGLLTCLNLKSRHAKKRFSGSSPSAPGGLQEPCSTHGPQNEVRESWGCQGGGERKQTRAGECREMEEGNKKRN